jgi:hypothetical protein
MGSGPGRVHRTGGVTTGNSADDTFSSNAVRF